MRLRFEGVERVGRALDCRDLELDPETVVRAVRDPADDRIRGPRPGPLHDHVGLVRKGMSLDERATLAAVARSRGVSPPALDRLAAARERLADHEVGSTARCRERERVADAVGARERFRERVAELRGEVRTRREAGLDASEARSELREAARRLSEASSERSAAEQRLARERERARERYDERERRLALEDRVANLERETRARLAARAEPEVRAALARLTDEPSEHSPPHLRALAAARVGTFAAPLVVATGPFDTEMAAAWLGTPLIRL